MWNFLVNESDWDCTQKWDQLFERGCNSGQSIVGTIFGFLILIALSLFLCWRFLNERKRWKEEQRTHIEGVLNKSEIKSVVNSIISKTEFETPFYLIYVDIDKYSQVVNSFGQKAARDVVIQVASKIDKVLPFQTPMGRTHEDSFVVVMKQDKEYQEVVDLADTIMKIFESPIEISFDVQISITATISIAGYPRHGKNFNQLSESLEIATYTGKRNGGNTVIVYSEEMGLSENENKQYYEQVKEAMRNKEFVLFYQPIADINTKEIIGAEALLRWEHKTLGLINPKEFINILEQSGDIYWVGIWEIEQMIKEYNLVKSNYPNAANFRLSLNLSTKQLINENLVYDFQKVIKKYRVNPKEFIIELEEFIMYEQQKVINDNLIKLHDLGFGIAVDGYTFDHNTLLKLDKLPIDIIKLDSSFLLDENQEIMRGMTELIANFAKKKNIDMVAERVENLDMIQYFQTQDIHIIQGYFLSKPISETALIDFMGKSEKILDAMLKGEKYVDPDEIAKQEAANAAQDAPLSEQTPVEDASNDEVVEEQPAEETSTQEVVEEKEDRKKKKSKKQKDEEQPVQEAVEEPTNEEVPTEEQSVQEVVEEPANEEPSTEEQSAPEVAEEAPIAEPGSEEQQEPASEEEKVEQPKKEQPAPEVENESPDDLVKDILG